MARSSRKTLIPSDEVGYYHVFNRCVRGAYLSAPDANPTILFDRRKRWIQARIGYLCQALAVEVCDFSLMDNHFHLILRNRPDLVPCYSDEEVALRWWHLHPMQKDSKGRPAEPRDFQLRIWTDDTVKMTLIRQQLSNISYFMKLFSEYVARRANAEDDQHGAFFEKRFKVKRLLHEQAILACSAYVNLNHVRAGITTSLELSPFTSGYERIQALLRWKRKRALNGQRTDTVTVQDETSIEGSLFLCPVRLTAGWELVTTPKHNPYPANRASHRGFLPMGLLKYLQMVDWTARHWGPDKPQRIPHHLEPILDRLQLDGDGWLKSVEQAAELYGTATGRTADLRREAVRRGRPWIHGPGRARDWPDA